MRSRRLPSLNGLRAFESTARRLSFSRAADELCVTQGAISRLVGKLEDDLNVRLFRRRGQKLELTPEGARLFVSVHEAFEKIEHGLAMFNSGRDDRLKIKVPPTFGIRWFIPRLVQFHALHPQIEFQITTSHQPVDFEAEDVDLAIHWGDGSWSGLHVDFLLGEQLTPVCSPRLLQNAPLREPSELASHVLLRSINRTDDWGIWLGAAKVTGIDVGKALQFENSCMTYQAAIQGLGVVVAQVAFVADDLAARRLVAPFPLTVPGERSYFLVCPREHARDKRLVAFREWLLGVAADPARDQP